MANELVLEGGVWKFRTVTQSSGEISFVTSSLTSSAGEPIVYNTSSLDSIPTGSTHPTSSLSEYNTSLTVLTQVT